MNLFNDEYIKAWWQLMEEGIHDGILNPGVDYIIEDRLLYISFGPVHSAYVRRLVEKELPRHLLLSPPQMKRVLFAQKDYLYDLRKRLSAKVNVNCAVFLWNNQVQLPVKKLRKVK